MNRNKKIFNIQENHLYELLSLLSAIITPIFALFWIYINSNSYFYTEVFIWIIACYFVFIYLLKKKINYIGKNIHQFLFVGFYLVSFLVIILNILNNFSIEYSLLLMLVIFYITLTFNKLKSLIVYIITILLTVGTTLIYFYIHSLINRQISLILFMCLIVFFAVGIVNMLLRNWFIGELKMSQQDYQRLLDMSPDAIVVHDSGKILYANQATANLLNLSVEKIINKSVYDYLHQSQHELTINNLEILKKEPQRNYKESQIILPNNHKIDIEASNILTSYNNKAVLMSIIRDIGDRKRMQKELIEAEDKYRTIVESAIIGVFLIQDKKVVYSNQFLNQIIGFKVEHFNIDDIYDLIYEDDVQFVKRKIENLKETNHENILEFRVNTKNNKLVYLQVHFKQIVYQSTPSIMGLVIEITEKKKAEEKIKYMALNDALTNLPNRYALDQYLKTKMNVTKPTRTPLGIIFIDLDRFKNINDTLGHSFGDLVLQRVSSLLKSCIKETDFISRYGGDEFIIVINQAYLETIYNIVNHIISTFSEPFYIKNHELYITPSIGISIYPTDGDDIETLIKYADIAMYNAKLLGRNTYQFYTSDLQNSLIRKMELESSLRKALSNHEFELYYQPLINISSNTLYGLEALIRWNHPKLGLISPIEFIPIAEETGLIIAIGEWVLNEACLQSKNLMLEHQTYFNISVNISDSQLKHSNFINSIQQVLKSTHLDPSYLEIEITESLLKDIDTLNHVLNELKKIGVRISIDDFGVGYSSISILQDITIDSIKIDKSFTKNININHKTEALIKAMIQMGEYLNCHIIVEGIEENVHIDFLRDHKCHIGQGFYFSKPVNKKEISQFISKFKI